MRFWSWAKASGNTLQSNITIELRIGGPIHLTHAALADLFRNFVVADGRPDQMDPPRCLARLGVHAMPWSRNHNANPEWPKCPLSWPELAGVGLSELESDWRGHNAGTLRTEAIVKVFPRFSLGLGDSASTRADGITGVANAPVVS